MLQDYNNNVQKLFLEFMIQDPTCYTRVQNIYNPENFDRSLQATARFISTHATKYTTLPDRKQIEATTGVKLQIIEDINDGHIEWFLEEFESFTRRQELERAILKSADLIEKGEYDPIEKLIKDAVQISLTRDMGTDYFDDPAARLNRYFNQGGQISTGWPQLDKLTYGGFSRGELILFSGGSGTGKSLLKMNLALNWLVQGLSGAYITLELSEELSSLRTDAMLTNAGTREIRKNIEDTHLKIKLFAKKMGKYRIKWLPAQSNINDIRAYLKEVQIQTNLKIDFVMVDYLDLLMPVSIKVNPSDLFTKDKYVSEELRNLAKELDIIMVSSSQLNRSSVNEVEFDHSHIAGGISKINTSDFAFAIFTSRSMKERGKYQLQCLKSRNSTGVGNKIDLDYDIDTMRITDPGEPTDANTGYIKKPNVYEIIKNTTEESVKGEPVESGQSSIQSARLKKLLGDIKGESAK